MFEFLQNGIDIYLSGGPVMYPLGLLSVVALAIVLERLWVLRRTNYLDVRHREPARNHSGTASRPHGDH